MEITIEEKKQKALELMQKLDIYKPYINGFKKNNDICMFEGFGGGYWAYQYPELINKVKEIEEKYDCLVYAVTHELTDFGEIYDLLIVTDYRDEWDYLLEDYENKQHIAMAYCWNVTEPDFSEFGSIGLKNFGGGIIRTC